MLKGKEEEVETATYKMMEYTLIKQNMNYYRTEKNASEMERCYWKHIMNASSLRSNYFNASETIIKLV